MPLSFAIGADQTVYPSRGINQGIGVGSMSYDDTQKFSPVNTTLFGYQIGMPIPGGIEGRVARLAPANSMNKAFRYVQCVATSGLPPDGESTTNPGFFNRTGITIPRGKYFWAIAG